MCAGEQMRGFVEVMFLFLLGGALYAVVTIAKQIDHLISALDRIEARLALIKPLRSEEGIIEEIRKQANPSAEIQAMLRGPLGRE